MLLKRLSNFSLSLHCPHSPPPYHPLSPLPSLLQERGSEVILGDESHISVYEQGGVATLGGVHPRTVPTGGDGTMDLNCVEQAVRKEDDHYPVTRLICLENTHNRRVLAWPVAGTSLCPYSRDKAAITTVM